LKLLLLIPAAVLFALGAEGLYLAARARDAIAIDCAEFARARPASRRVLVTGCAIDYAGAGYRASSGEIEEIYLPARPGGQQAPAPIVIAARDTTGLEAAQAVLGNGRTATSQQSVAVMAKVSELLQVTRVIDGLVREGYIERFRSRRILSGLAASLAPDVVIVDLNGRPDFRWPALALAASVVLMLLARAQGRQTQPARYDQVEPVITFPWLSEAAGPTPVHAAARAQAGVSLPRLLLLSLDARSGPEAIEAAPPLGTRQTVVEILRGVVPDLTAGSTPRVLARPDGTLTFDLGTIDPVPTAVIDARGEAGVALVKEVLLMTGWRAFAPKTGLFVTIDELTTIGALADQMPAR
jgi:hypothetical protein